MSASMPDIVDQLADGVMDAFTAGLGLQAHYGDTPLQELIDAGVTGEDFWAFFMEAVNRDTAVIADLSHEGTLGARAEAWKVRRR